MTSASPPIERNPSVHTPRLNSEVFISPTPQGVLQATSGRDATADTALLRGLLRSPDTPRLTHVELRSRLGPHFSTESDATALVADMEDRHLLQGFPEPLRAPGESLEDLLPEFLPPLSGRRRALLADAQGFCLSSVGFDPDDAVSTAAAAARLALLDAHRDAAVGPASQDPPSAWAQVDATGSARTTYWPLHIGEHLFVLVVAGLPRLNHPRLVDLAWALSIRYDEETDP